MTAYNLIARIRITDPQRLDPARSELARLQRLTQREPACRVFQIYEDRGQEGDFLLWESWDGKAGLDAHFAAPHTKEYLELNLTEVIEVTELDALETEDL